MQTKRLILLLSISFSLFTGCGAKKEEVITVPPLSAQAGQFSMGTWSVTSFGQFCGYIQSGRSLEIYPYFDLEPHIVLKVINLSGSPFLEYMNTCFPDGRILDYENCTIVTDGTVTYGYRIFDEFAIAAESASLPSDYVVLALENIWLGS